MSKTNSATSSHLSSSDEDSIPLTNSKKGVASTSKPISIKKAAAVVADPESESSDSESEPLVATAKSRKDEKSRYTVKKAVVSKPSTPAKRVAVVSPDEPSAKKGTSSGMFKRLWTEEDEITVLKQMVKYKAEKGVYALSDSKKFHAFVKDALVGGFDRSQVTGKARKLKLRYKNSSGKKNLTPHEEKLMKLSKLVWGANYDTNSVKKAAAVSNGHVKDSDQVEDEDEDEDDAGEEDEADDDDDVVGVGDAEDDADADDNNEPKNVCKTKREWKFIGKKSIAMGLNADTVNAGLERCSDAVKVGIEEEWEQFHLEEAALFQKQLNLVIKESNCIVQALEK